MDEVVHDIFGHEEITNKSKVLEDVEDRQVQLLLHMQWRNLLNIYGGAKIHLKFIYLIMDP